ncbi:MAG: hypothetical protein M0Z43_09765 [Acidithiobacillus sp.]|nr:hypothetical protein [Acidithiobacillus sp.]
MANAANFWMYASMVLAGIVAIEQILAQIPALNSNSTFQLICNITNSAVEIGKKLFGNVTPPTPPAQ